MIAFFALLFFTVAGFAEGDGKLVSDIVLDFKN